MRYFETPHTLKTNQFFLFENKNLSACKVIYKRIYFTKLTKNDDQNSFEIFFWKSGNILKCLA